MRWTPDECRPGDIVRVKLGAVYHYGVFVSEDEVIQFGEPPVNALISGSDKKVLATDIETFSAGGIVERSELDRSEEKKRFPREKTVALARSRIGEGGYDIIHNNCEHFAYECLFGVGRSLQEEELRKKWQSRPFLDVYVALIPDTLELSPVFPPERQAEIERVNNARSKREKYAVWRLLEKALSRSLGLGIDELSFKKRRDGKWTADGIEFSLTHSKGACAVAVSSRPVGIDIENADDFISRYSDGDKLRSLSRRVSTVSELKEAADPEAFLRLWTKKEAIFKLSGKGSFFPHKIDTAKTPTETRLVCLPAAYSVSVAGERLDKLRFYRVTDNGAHQMSADEMK